MKTIYLLLLSLLIWGCVREDVTPRFANETERDLAESLLSALARSDYSSMQGNLISAIELHRIVMQRKIEDDYRDLSLSEKKDYDARVLALSQHVDELADSFETEFWTLLNLGNSRCKIDWAEVTITRVDTGPTDESFFHQPVQRLNIFLTQQDTEYVLKIPMAIETIYGWRILSLRMDIDEFKEMI